MNQMPNQEVNIGLLINEYDMKLMQLNREYIFVLAMNKELSQKIKELENKIVELEKKCKNLEEDKASLENTLRLAESKIKLYEEKFKEES